MGNLPEENNKKVQYWEWIVSIGQNLTTWDQSKKNCPKRRDK